MSDAPPPSFQPLAGVRVLSLALNLPGPAALMRCRAMGAECIKFEPPAGDPMRHYNTTAYAALHAGVEVRTVDLKQPDGQAALHEALARTDVLLTSFRPSALAKLGLDPAGLRRRHPRLSQVAIVGAAGARAEEPGHDLTYLADAGLVTGTALPPTLYADMGGALLASEAVLQAVIQASWGLTVPAGAVGGAHAGYRVYPCADGRVAVAALEPHFAARLCEAAGLPPADMADPATHRAIATWLAGQTRAALDALAHARDIPLHTLAPDAA